MFAGATWIEKCAAHPPVTGHPTCEFINPEPAKEELTERGMNQHRRNSHHLHYNQERLRSE